MKQVYHLMWLSLGLFISCTPSEEKKDKPLNVLFIAVDDLRPDINAYGNSMIKSPNIDKLASSGTVFENHYVQVPTCGASRCSILTGLLPRTQRHLQNSAVEEFLSNESEGEQPESFVHHFRRNGYYTLGLGKISHSVDGLWYGYNESPEGAKPEMPHSWDEFLFDADKWETGWNAFFGYADGSNRQGKNNQVKPYEMADVDDRGYPDGITADLAVEKLGELNQKDQPFLMAVGFFKPHLPFTAPKKYWDLYDRDKIPLSPVPDLPEDVHRASLQNMGEFNQYKAGEEKASLDERLSDDYATTLRHAYYASVSYVDAQIGKVLDQLEELGLAENTIVVLWGDHGWHLGDHRVWGKHTNFEVALRSPLILRIPGEQVDRVGGGTVVSSVDLYPSLVEWCGLPDNVELDGQSLSALTRDGEDPNRENLAFSYFSKGISMRNERFRLTKFFREQSPTVELFDHQLDSLESKNLASDFPDVVEQLMSSWEKGNTGLFDQ
ncbi:sulfatase [Pleomorphovibrio marinus]|uniref:sulfatase n=1 Tax=Pleomorphovibrio marinus TaxID=2164132 RepID=UPI000E0B4326|nr:sulfatase [Pleomorphovibrio marinus]